MPKKPKISRSVEAKKKLNGHLKGKTATCYFTPTESVAWYWWRVINKAAFKNKLPYPEEIVIRKLRGAWGLCNGKTKNGYDSCIITLTTDIKDRKMFIATVAHEMVHQWQWHTRRNFDHTTSFRGWSSYFKRNFGIVI